MNPTNPKYLFFLFALLLTSTAFSQVPDTVVVYEYVYVTDTVWVERDICDFKKLEPNTTATLLIDTTTMKASLSIFSSGKTATIPINHIILTENNQKLKSMKKLSFLSLTFFAISTSAFPQSSNEKTIGIHLRANSISQKEIYFLSEKQTSGSYHKGSLLKINPSIGIKGNLPLNKSLSFSPRINYLKINALTNAGYIGVKKEGSEDFYGHFSGKNAESNLKEKGYEIFSPLYEPSYTNAIHAITTDIFLNYDALESNNLNCRIYGGLRVDFLIAKDMLSTESSLANNLYKKAVFNYTVGIGFDFIKRVYLEMEYSTNINPYAETSLMKANYTTASLNLGYYLFRY